MKFLSNIKSLLLPLLLGIAVTAQGAEGFYTSGHKLLDANGNEFVMRGANYPFVWFKDKASTVIPAAKRVGCNALRISLSNGGQYKPETTAAELTSIINLCEQNKLAVVFTTHDDTGSDNVADLNRSVDFWIKNKDLLNAHRKTVIINISNEWYGTWNNASAWAEGYKSALQRLRQAGVHNTLVIDCAGYGQWPESMYQKGSDVIAADTEHNMMFSIHFYDTAGRDDNTVYNHFTNTLKLSCPMLVGEFSYKHNYNDVAYQKIMELCTTNNVGYLVWSWTGNSGGGTEDCDMFGSWDESQMKPNGTATINGTYGIKATSRELTVYDPNASQGGGDQPVNPEDPTENSTTVLWSGSVDFGNDWETMFEYKNSPSECPQWNSDAMILLQAGDRLRFTFANTGSAPQIQLNFFGMDDNWSWQQVFEYTDIYNSVYEYEVTGNKVGEYTDLEMLRNRGLAAKGQQATVVKLELIKGNGGNGGNGSGEEPEQPEQPENPLDPDYDYSVEDPVDNGVWENNVVIAENIGHTLSWDTEYHVTAAQLGTIRRGDKIHISYSVSNKAPSANRAKPTTTGELQVAYKSPNVEWGKYIDAETISGTGTRDIEAANTTEHPEFIRGLNYDGLYLKGNGATLTAVKVTRLVPSVVSSVSVTDGDSNAGFDLSAPFEIYTLDGKRTSQMLPGHIYILRQGDKVIKHVMR